MLPVRYRDLIPTVAALCTWEPPLSPMNSVLHVERSRNGYFQGGFVHEHVHGGPSSSHMYITAIDADASRPVSSEGDDSHVLRPESGVRLLLGLVNVCV